MSNLTLIERTRVMRLALNQARRRSVAGILGSPLLRWRYGAPVAEALAMVPQELRPADPSFAEEVALGYFGLARTSAFIGEGTPFDITPPSEAWARELHGFGWLRGLAAASNEAATARARFFVKEWIGYGEARHNVAWLPEVVGRRIISWLCNASLLLDNVDQAVFDRTADSLVDQLVSLSAAWGSAPEGYPRLEALLGVVYGDFCILGHERHLAASESKLATELARQILPDGGHISRNADVLLQLLLDLLPLRQCYLARTRPFPAGIDAAMSRMSRMLRFMRLGDGTLARFNGVGDASIAELSAVLAYDHSSEPLPQEAPQSRYVRLARGGLVLVADTGTAPPMELAACAHAGMLSFELSAGSDAIFVNLGSPRALEAQYGDVARSTASHTTLTLGDRSSGRLLRDERLARLVGGAPVRTSGSVSASLSAEAEGLVLTASHEGYAAAYGLIHARRIRMTNDGSVVEGSDRLSGPGRAALRLSRDVPFAIRFHLHPRCTCEPAGGGDIVIRPPGGDAWRFAVHGAEPSVEPSRFFADPSGAVKTRQIVLRGACWGETEVVWRLLRGA